VKDDRILIELKRGLTCGGSLHHLIQVNVSPLIEGGIEVLSANSADPTHCHHQENGGFSG